MSEMSDDNGCMSVGVLFWLEHGGTVESRWRVSTLAFNTYGTNAYYSFARDIR